MAYHEEQIKEKKPRLLPVKEDQELNESLLIKLAEEIKTNYKFSRRRALIHLLDELIKEQRPSS